MKKTLIFITVFALYICIHSVVPLQQAIENGIRINTEIQNNDLESKILKVDNKIKISQKYFTLNGNGYYLYKSDKTEIAMPDINIAPGMSISGLKISGGVYHNFDFKVSLTQPIFTGNAISGMISMNELRQALTLNERELLELMLGEGSKLFSLTIRCLKARTSLLQHLKRE